MSPVESERSFEKGSEEAGSPYYKTSKGRKDGISSSPTVSKSMINREDATQRHDRNSTPGQNFLPASNDNRMFSNYHGFFLVPSSGFDKQNCQEIHDMIIANGSIVVSSETPLDSISNTITVVAENIDFPEYAILFERMVLVVTPQWIYDSVNQGRPLPYRPYSPDPHLFFSGVMVCASGLSQGDREAIYAGVMAYGGQYDNGLTKFTTHIITTNINEEKCQTALELDYPNPIKMVLPHWVDDCLKLGRRVDESLYLFPNPPILNTSVSDLSASPPTDSSIGPFFKSDLPKSKASTIFSGKRFYISQDFELSVSILSMVNKMICNSDGTIVYSAQEANVYVGKFRHGDEYIQASRRNNCTVGNLDWVYWMVSHNKWTSPLRMLLHYPIGVDGVPGMKGCLISLTNFTGPARQFIERVIVACGARYTGSLKKECTHLIAARPTGLKFEAARQWNIHVVNHLWLEESYALWHMQSVAVLRYIHFPPLLDLTCIVGQTQLRMKNLRQFFAPLESLEPIRTPRAAGEKAKLAVHESMAKETEYQQKLKSNRRKLLPLAEELGDEGPRKKRSRDIAEGKENQEREGEEDEDDIVSSSAQKRTLPVTPSSTIPFSSATPSLSSPIKKSPPSFPSKTTPAINTYGRRSRQKIHNTIAHQLGHEDPVTPESEKKVAGTADVVPTDIDMRPPSRLNVIITSVANVPLPNKTAEISIHQVNDAKDADYIVSPRVVRTEKFLIALARVKSVLKPEYIDACLTAGKILWPVPAEYLLNDSDLNRALAKASKLRRDGCGLFDGLSFNVTPDVNGGVNTFNRIVEAHGASPSHQLSSSKARKFNQSSNNRAILITNDKNDQLIRSFKELVGITTYVFTSDWVIQSILNMSVDFEEKSYAL